MKHSPSALAVPILLLGLGCVSVNMPGRSYRGPVPSLSREQLALADELRAHVQVLAGEIGERNAGLKYSELQMVAAYLERTLESVGYEVGRQTYEVQDPRFGLHGKKLENLVVELSGLEKEGEIVLVGAHYDSVWQSPGANDNGSGTPALLALARRFFDRPGYRTLRFALFVNEEPPYFKSAAMGSLVYSRAARDRGDNIVAMLNLETIGYYSD